MVSTHIDYAQVERSIGFHGAPMQKVWEGERGDSDLARADVKPDFSVYHMRQKNFLFQDRTKRLKLHQFLARKASVLYRKVTKSELRQQQQLALGDEASATAAASAATASQGMAKSNRNCVHGIPIQGHASSHTRLSIFFLCFRPGCSHSAILHVFC